MSFKAKAQSLGKVGKTKLTRIMKKFWKDANSEYEIKDKKRKAELNQIFQHKIQKYLPPKEVKINPNKYALRMFANYLGCWWFDIVFSRDDHRKRKDRGKTSFTMNKKQGYIQITNPGQSIYGVFINANSKMCYINQMYNRTATECNRVVADFRLWCAQHHFPVVKIISDYEGGMAQIADIERHVAQGNHHRFGIIDGFVNAARQYSWANGDGGELIPSHFANFVNNVWNKDLVRGTNHTREQMIQNPNFEEEYIAKCIYYNADQLERRQETIQPGINVKLKYDEKQAPFEHRPGKLRPGIWEVVALKPNGKMLARSEFGEEREVYKTSVNKLILPQRTEITEQMINSLPDQPEELTLKPIPQIIPSDTPSKAKQYEQSIEQIKEQIVKEVVQEINKRKDNDISQGFMPIRKPEQLDRAVEETTQNAELAKRSRTYGYKNRSYIDRSKIRKAANEIVDQIFTFKLPPELTDGKFHSKVYGHKNNHNEHPSTAIQPLK